MVIASRCKCNTMTNLTKIDAKSRTDNIVIDSKPNLTLSFNKYIDLVKAKPITKLKYHRHRC